MKLTKTEALKLFKNHRVISASKKIVDDIIILTVKLESQPDMNKQTNDNAMLAEIKDLIVGINTRLDKIEVRLDNIENRLDKVEFRLDKVETRLNNIENVLKKHDNAMVEHH